MEITKWPLNDNVRALFLPGRKYFESVLKAKEIDKLCVYQYGQIDKSHHLVCLQRQHAREGVVILEIFTSMYGFQVRDTDNFGCQQYLSRGASAEEALKFCQKFYDADSKNRGVIIGYVSEEFMIDFDLSVTKS